jgi:hypothetical protein
VHLKRQCWRPEFWCVRIGVGCAGTACACVSTRRRRAAPRQQRRYAAALAPAPPRHCTRDAVFLCATRRPARLSAAVSRWPRADVWRVYCAGTLCAGCRGEGACWLSPARCPSICQRATGCGAIAARRHSASQRACGAEFTRDVVGGVGVQRTLATAAVVTEEELPGCVSTRTAAPPCRVHRTHPPVAARRCTPSSAVTLALALVVVTVALLVLCCDAGVQPARAEPVVEPCDAAAVHDAAERPDGGLARQPRCRRVRGSVRQGRQPL